MAITTPHFQNDIFVIDKKLNQNMIEVKKCFSHCTGLNRFIKVICFSYEIITLLTLIYVGLYAIILKNWRTFVINRLISSLRQPRQINNYLNDSKSVVFLYMMLLTILTFLPTLFLFSIQGVISDSSYPDFYDAIQSDMFSKNNILSDGTFLIEEDISFTYDMFRFSNQDALTYQIQIKFLESGMSMQISNQEIAFSSYDSGLFVDFNDTSIQSVSTFTRYVERFIESVSMITVIYGFSLYLSSVIDYIFITLFLTLLMSFSIFKSPLTFKKKFKLGIYLSTSYAVFNMVTLLFQFQVLQFFSLLVTYFYYVAFYKQFKGGPLSGKI